MTGVVTGGKPINLSQLRDELAGQGLEVGLGSHDDMIYTYDDQGQFADFTSAQQPTVEAAIANHVAMRDKTDAELAAEFQTPGTTAARKQEIRDMQSGLMPREQVPMT